MTEHSGNTTCVSFPEHPEYCDAVNIVRRVFGAFSCIACLFVFFIIWAFGRHVVFVQRLILFLTIAAFFNSSGRVFQDSTSQPGHWCTFQAFWLTYFNYAVVLWVVCITFNLFMNVVRGVATKNYEKWYHGVTWGLSLFISLLPLMGQRYGPSGSWCWIVKDPGWQVGIWYGPLMTMFVVLALVYGYIVFTMYRKANNWTRTFEPEARQAQDLLKEEIKPLRLYPFVFLLLSIFPLANRIQNLTSDGQHNLGLLILHAMSACVQGAAYSLVFTLDPHTLRSLTPAQIKTALMKKWSPPVVVQEYPAAVVDIEDTAQSAVQPHLATVVSTEDTAESAAAPSNSG